MSMTNKKLRSREATSRYPNDNSELLRFSIVIKPPVALKACFSHKPMHRGAETGYPESLSSRLKINPCVQWRIALRRQHQKLCRPWSKRIRGLRTVPAFHSWHASLRSLGSQKLLSSILLSSVLVFQKFLSRFLLPMMFFLKFQSCFLFLNSMTPVDFLSPFRCSPFQGLVRFPSCCLFISGR